MGFKMSNFNIMGAHGKIRFLRGRMGGRILEKLIYRRNCLKGRGGGGWTVCKFKRPACKKRDGGVFLRGEVSTPMQTMDNWFLICNLSLLTNFFPIHRL